MNPQDEILSLDWRVEYTDKAITSNEYYDCSLNMKEVIRDFGRDFPNATIKSVQRAGK